LLLGAALIQADSVYASPALREAVARAAALNREPPELRSYRALVETEAALVIHTAAGEELTGQIEQIASHIQWWRDGNVDQHIVGHRIQSAGPTWSVLTYLRSGWTFPVLYGERLGLFGLSVEGRPQQRRRPVYHVVHPFSEEREHTYRFEGGDTIAVLRLPDRDVRVMRIRVTPRRPPHERALAFHGDIDLDADRYQIVRMRGRLVVFGPEPGPATRLLSLAARGFAYIELENAEYEGRYWLPYRQRLELQATSNVTDSRAIIRIVSSFRDHRIEVDGTAAALALGPQTPDSAGLIARAQVADSAGPTGRAQAPDSALVPDTVHAADARQPRFRLTFAPADTLTGYDGWSWDLGEATAGLSARDFDDVAPPALRADGPPHVRLGARRITDVLRFNRIEGLFTGAGAVLAFRDVAPGLELRGAGGWAWSERTPRGSMELALRRDDWELGIRAARDLDHTNDFTAPLEQGAGVFMLFGAGDDYDYVDRRGVIASVARALGHDAGVRLELGFLEDRPVARQRLRGPYGGDTLRLNRPAAPGDYIRSRLVLERGRSVNGSSLQPGLGVRAVIEHAAGELDWTRVESGLSLRTTRGRFLFSARFDAGLVLGDAPPQTLYELGTAGRLPGYPYKAFGGDRAALLRGSALYDLPILDAPIRIGPLVFPGLAPSPAVRWEAGWAAARERSLPALQALGSRETGGIRSAVALQLTFFGGMLGVGIARPLEAGRDWEPLVNIGGVL
ncbi:MAG TPA: hypothetical protein VIL18_13820, partial [Longimicrobiales bacterium]